MKILVFAGGTTVSGAEINILDVMRALRADGHDIFCVANGWTDGDFPRRLALEGIPYREVKLGFLYLTRPLWTLDTLANYPRGLLEILLIVRAFNPDIVYHASYRSLLMLPFLSSPKVTVVHEMNAEPPSIKARFFYGIARRRAAVFVAASRFVRQNLMNNGVPADQICVVYPVVAISSVRGVVPHDDARSFRIGIVGQVIPRKGHEDLLLALSRLVQQGYECKLDVFGRGPSEWGSELRAFAQRLGVAKLVVWHGFVSDRSAIYSGLDVVVVPTRDHEPFGLVAAEPALWQIPVIASAGGGLQEIVTHGETGLLFKRGDVAELASNLAALMSDRALSRRLGTNAREYVQKAFSAAACQTAMAEVISRVASAKSVPG